MDGQQDGRTPVIVCVRGWMGGAEQVGRDIELEELIGLGISLYIENRGDRRINCN